MKQHPAGTLLSLACAWILWEEQTMMATASRSEGTTEWNAAREAGSLDECHATIPGLVQWRSNQQKEFWKRLDALADIQPGDAVVVVKLKKDLLQIYRYKCIPGKMDPRH